MFERFTSDARATVIGAQQHARRLGQRPIGTEHLLRAIVDGTGPAAVALAARGISPSTVEADLVASRPAGRDADRQALATIGIDLDAVLAAAGADPTDDHARTTRSRRRRWWHIGRANCGGPGERAHIPFCPRAKKALELSLREALRLRQRLITTDHLLLGILREGDGLACRLLADRGVPLAELRHDVEQSLRRTA